MNYLIKEIGMTTHNCPENDNLITNFSKHEEPIYRRAIALFGNDNLYITDEAYDTQGRLLGHKSAVRYKEPCDRKDIDDFHNIVLTVTNDMLVPMSERELNEMIQILHLCDEVKSASFRLKQLFEPTSKELVRENKDRISLVIEFIKDNLAAIEAYVNKQ